MPAPTRLKQRKALSWMKMNEILKSAEPGYESDTGKLKIGDGVTRWNDLPYFGGSTEEVVNLPSVTVTDNGDGTFTMSGDGVIVDE